MDSHPDASIIHQPILFSDHAAIILRESVNTRRSPYKIENWCLGLFEVSQIIGFDWKKFHSGSFMYSISRKLDEGLNTFKMQKIGQTFLCLRDEKISRAQTTFLFWKQRCKVRWDAFVESHSSLLIRSVQAHRRRDKIMSLKDENGVWASDQAGISSLLEKHFATLYNCHGSSAPPTSCQWDDLEIPTLSELDYQFLMTPFSALEIKDAMFHIGSDISPRGLMEWNRTFFVLLPKLDHPETASRFRPIGLCNVLYKCIAKCLTNRLRRVLPSLISDTQNAFVPARLMADNGLLAHELLSYMSSSSSKVCSASLKLDMNKVYDRVNWDFLWDVLRRFGFPPYWMMHYFFFCVSPAACDHILDVINEFCSISGQMVNLQKSFFRFSSNTPDDFRDYLSKNLKMTSRSSIGECLWLPVDIDRSKCRRFQFMIDKLMRHLSVFSSLRLSATAKLVVITSVLIASFNHVLSMFKVPATRSGKDSRGLAMAPAAVVYLPKGLEGLGVRHLRSFNVALFAKQSWRLRHNPLTLSFSGP
ncbi:uncharacterized protein LOC110702317 [Chenopodium quinoa]|uniref:uncharacterized protein LOC110702317 n=1 Tax=Chenopodium quinoa TaxID=63459 RepID=UPI000B76DFAC|nr:uncharacterized protein LOC110702317 [Chenopodium quinoa]